MSILVLFFPFLLLGLGLVFVAWIIKTLTTIEQENKKIRKLLEYKLSLSENEKLILYDDTDNNTWKSVFNSKLVLLMLAVIVVIIARLLLKIYHIW